MIIANKDLEKVILFLRELSQQEVDAPSHLPEAERKDWNRSVKLRIQQNIKSLTAAHTAYESLKERLDNDTPYISTIPIEEDIFPNLSTAAKETLRGIILK